KDVDNRSDVYSLGIILFEMLTGRPPFQAETPVGTLLAHVRDPLPPPRSLNPDISAGVEEVVTRSLAKAADDRFPSAGELARALATSVNDEPATVFSMRSPLSPEMTVPRMPTTGIEVTTRTPVPAAAAASELQLGA